MYFSETIYLTAHNKSKSGEVLLVGGDHGVYMSTFALEQADFSFEVFNLFRQEFNKILQVLPFFIEFIFLGNIIIFLNYQKGTNSCLLVESSFFLS